MHEMGRAWQFFLTVAITITAFAYLYYTSDYYTKGSEPPSPAAAATAAPGQSSTAANPADK
jgi:hypothetical protein